VATPTTEETSVGLGEPWSRSELVLEMIALLHQITVNHCAEAQRNPSPLFQALGSTVLALAVVAVAALA
jgi:hypothetical protein